MKREMRMCVAGVMSALALWAAPALAQDAPATNSAVESIGPPQLRDFSLNGTVTREAAPPAAAAPRPSASTRPPAATDDASRASAAQRQQAPPAQTRTAQQPTPRSSIALPPAGAAATAATDYVSPPDVAPAFSQTEAPPAPTPFDTATGAALSGPMSALPWLFAALVLGGAVIFFLMRHRGRYALAAADGGMAFDLQPEERPQPLARSPLPPPAARPSPSPSPPKPAGVVSTSLRPWIDFELSAERAIVDEQTAAIEFELFVSNSGSAPARDLTIQAAMFNAGPDQDQAISDFFATAHAAGEAPVLIQPLNQVQVRSRVALTFDQLRQFEVQGRRVFVPLIAVTARYRWSSGEGLTAASWLVGRETSGEKMAPFRLDLGPRLFRGLGIREHALRIRS